MILFTSVTVACLKTFFSRADVTTHDGEYLRVTRLPIPPPQQGVYGHQSATYHSMVHWPRILTPFASPPQWLSFMVNPQISKGITFTSLMAYPLSVSLVVLAHYQYNILKGVMSMAERKGSSGRIPDSKRPQHKLFQKVNVSIDPDTFDRLEVYCAEQERARSWAIQKALDVWLANQGY